MAALQDHGLSLNRAQDAHDLEAVARSFQQEEVLLRGVFLRPALS
jgi:hypothetical protein